MAHVLISETKLDPNELSADLVGSGQVLASNDTFEIERPGIQTGIPGTGQRIMIIEAGAGATTVTFNAGPEPPSMRGSLGPITFNLAANDVRAVSLEAGRFHQTDGKHTGSVTGAPRITVLRLHTQWS